MGLGVLESSTTDSVPGTARVLDDRRDSEHSVRNPNLKYKGDIILVPQPSDDPMDPLNWPLWRRDLTLLLVVFLTILAATMSSMLAINTSIFAEYFCRTFDDVFELTGYHFLAVAISGFFFVPSARVWGKRHLLIFSTVVTCFSTAWAAATKNDAEKNSPDGCALLKNNYHSLMAARVIQGLALAPLEAFINAIVGDLYFVHERGIRMALTNLALVGGAYSCPIIVGKMTISLGWDWEFWFVAIFSGAILPVVIFFLPETTYRRDVKPIPGSDSDNNSTTIDQHGVPVGDEKTTETHVGQGQTPSKPSYWQTIKPFNGRKTDEGFVRLLFRPIPLFFHPGIAWTYIIPGAMIGWNTLIAAVLSSILLAPPLNFTVVQSGYMFAGGLIGALIGFATAGVFADFLTKLMTKWNKGVFEPEFRLVLMIPSTLLYLGGLLGFGWLSSMPARYGPYPPTVLFGMQATGLVYGLTSSSLYVVDAHGDMAIEAFTCLLFFKNIFTYALSTAAYDWIATPEKVWITFRGVGGVQAGLCLLTIPLYVFGKKNRAFFARNPVFFKISDFTADIITCKVFRRKQ